MRSARHNALNSQRLIINYVVYNTPCTVAYGRIHTAIVLSTRRVELRLPKCHGNQIANYCKWVCEILSQVWRKFHIQCTCRVWWECMTAAVASTPSVDVRNRDTSVVGYFNHLWFIAVYVYRCGKSIAILYCSRIGIHYNIMLARVKFVSNTHLDVFWVALRS